MKKSISFLSRIMIMVLALLLGASSGVMMADASALPDAGVTEGGTGGIDTPPTGIATETAGREYGDKNFYMSDVDQRITKIRPMSTPIDQISRYAKGSHTDSFEVKYYSVSTREIKCTTTDAVSAMTSGASVTLPVSDTNMFTQDDTIRVVGVQAITKPDGTLYTSEDSNIPDLVLCVCGQSDTSNLPTVYAVNGNKDGDGQPIWVPEIPEGTTLVRMGKACGELDAQTGRFNSLPSAETQYCQNFMMQVEQSTLDKIAKKEVNWTFTDMEEDSIYDMRVGMENSFLFGVRQRISHVAKKGMYTWFTGGIWWMAGKDIELGEWDSDAQCVTISDDNLVDVAKDAFVGTGVGNKRKVWFCGSDVLATLSKIKSEKFRLKDTVEVWNLKFKSWDTDFGEILAIHHELLDLNGMSDFAFSLDPEYLSKRTHVSFERNSLDLASAGIRRTDALVLQEVSCLYLRNAKAHARIRLAQAPTTGA